MSTCFRDAIAKFVKAGIHPQCFIPVSPPAKEGPKVAGSFRENPGSLGKAPGAYRNGVWTGLGGDFVNQGLTRVAYTEMADWPTGNAGILGRFYPGIDVDTNSADAAALVKRAVIAIFGDPSKYGQRTRGDNYRTLYAFKAYKPGEVVTQTLHFTLPGDTEEKAHGIDILGQGRQYLIAGLHAAGEDRYGWREGRELRPDVLEITQTDVDAFVEQLTREVETAGGAITSRRAGVTHDEIDTRTVEPSMAPAAILAGLAKLPNTHENFPERDDIVSMVASIRAALGSEAEEYRDEIEAWACADESFCWPAYFDKIWDSTTVVRVSQTSLDRKFRNHGIGGIAAAGVFDEAETKDRREDTAIDREAVLDDVASSYVFRRHNTALNQNRFGMRSKFDPEMEWDAYAWYLGEVPESDHALLNRIYEHKHFHPGKKPDKIGFANFLRALGDAHPLSFFSETVRDPGFAYGEIFVEENEGASPRYLLNTRPMSGVMAEALKRDPDPARSKADVDTILEFHERAYGSVVDYELDTLAYMVQTGKRPGHLWFMVGDPGVGKTMLQSMQSNMFDGRGRHVENVISGAELINESAQRFAFSRIGGHRIIVVQELPERVSSKDQKTLTSKIKELVDPSSAGNFVRNDIKGVTAAKVKNTFRVLVSSNHANSLEIEPGDRRIFYIFCKITAGNKPNTDYYARLADIIDDPARLAAFWRYLAKRDVSAYEPNKAPPATEEKSERIILENNDPVVRHLAAAVRQLEASGAPYFSIARLKEVMTEMSDREEINAKFGERIQYTAADKITLGALGRAVQHRHPKLHKIELRTAAERDGIYVTSEGLFRELAQWPKNKLKEMVNEMDRRPLAEHPWETYRAASD